MEPGNVSEDKIEEYETAIIKKGVPSFCVKYWRIMLLKCCMEIICEHYKKNATSLTHNWYRCKVTLIESTNKSNIFNNTDNKI